MPETYAYLLKWGPGKGCSPSPFTSTTFKPVDSVLANLLGGKASHPRPFVLWAANISSTAPNQAWDSIVVVQYPDGCPTKPDAFAEQHALDRLCLRLRPGTMLSKILLHGKDSFLGPYIDIRTACKGEAGP
ncbi:g11032 [Coccomyxa viridis]|uniref:G11032 protein n=1 Tax=Coccomyxa viridis TaxID=1274662 RepID=A0ABP1GB53_9CHLO